MASLSLFFAVIRNTAKAFFIALIFCTPFDAKAADTPELRRGVNLSSWFANAPRQPLTMRDFRNIKNMGFDFVRLPVNPELIGFQLNGLPVREQRLDLHAVKKALDGLTQVGLAVVFDVHPESEFQADLEQGGYAEEQFVEFWQMLAEALRDYPKKQVAFELLNEPQYYNKSDRYNNFIARVVKAVRQIDPHRLLIVCAPGVASLEPGDALSATRLISDPNVAYDVHYYLPYIVSHQGMPSFSEKEIRYFRSVPYPSSLVDNDAVRRALAPEATPLKAMWTLRTYVKEKWNAARIAAYLEPIAAWSKKNNARVIVLEFGVLRNYIDSASRYRWIKDVRKSLEDNNLGWAYWDYTDGFGFMKLSGKTTSDPDGAVRFEDPSDPKNLRLAEPEALDAFGLAQPTSLSSRSR